MKRAIAAVATLLFVAALPALAAEATFERTLSVSGRVDLTVSTGSGNVHITRGSDNQVHIFGRVKAGWGVANAEQRVREIAAHPPIDQTGNIIRIGGQNWNLHNVSIDYDIQAPASSFLRAGSGSGDLTIDGVGEDAKLNTGSGNIHATSLRGGFEAHTGSGNIFAEQTGTGDVRAETGSGNVELHDVRGGLRATTGSGDIKVAGTAASDWFLQTGSGDVEFWPGGGGLLLDASTGSGEVKTDRQMSVQGTFNRHHVHGKINGGGPTVRIQTGSGDIRIH